MRHKMSILFNEDSVTDMTLRYIEGMNIYEKLVEIILKSWMTESGNISTKDAAQQ